MPSLRGENREQFLQICDTWYRRDRGQHVPCKIIEPSCQGGQSSLVRFWCKEKVVPQIRLTREATAAEGRAASGNYILGMPQIEHSKGSAEKRLQASVTVEPAKKENEAAKGRDICGNSILGVP